MARVEDANRRRIPTARAVFGASARIPGEGGAAILATAELEGAVNLAELLRSPATGRVPTRARNTSLARAGRAVRVAHDSGLDHADLNIGNILVAPVGRPAGMRAVAAAVAGGTDGVRSPGAYVIDLGLSRIGVSLGAGRRAANLIRLERSAEKHLGSGPRRIRDAAAFLHGYLAGPSPPDRRFRRALFRALRRRSILITVHRIGWWLRDWGT
jgi:tRNA A-37 threonylcarbamoyl transferase component Bud32